MSWRALGRGLWADLRVGVLAGLVAALALAPLEVSLALALGGAPLSVRVVLGFALLTATLFVLFGALVGLFQGFVLALVLHGRPLADCWSERRAAGGVSATSAAEDALAPPADGARATALTATFLLLPFFVIAVREVVSKLLLATHDRALASIAIAVVIGALGVVSAGVVALLTQLARPIVASIAARLPRERPSVRRAGRFVAGFYAAVGSAVIGGIIAWKSGSVLEQQLGKGPAPLVADAHAQVAILGAFVGLALGPALFALVRTLGFALRRLGIWNPLARIPGFLALLFVAGSTALEIAVRKVALFRDLALSHPALNPRLVTPALLFLLLDAGILVLMARGFTILPRDKRRRRIVLSLGGAALVVASYLSLFRLADDAMVRYLATSASPPVERIAHFANWLSDFDGDGYGEVVGENDCAPFNPAIHPGAIDLPDNGIDENCSGADFSLKGLEPPPPGAAVPLPKEFQKEWSFVVITIDATRYDHTSFGGYARDTTPWLARYARQSVDFTHCFSNSAGTVSSIPAILTSHFFHEEIFLGPEHSSKAGLPLILPANLMAAEVMKRAGYSTGAIVSHYYFNGWGLDQGFDSFDNEEGATNDPARVTSPAITNKAEAWLAGHQQQKFFLWLHYIDPHGYYEPHPGFPSWVDPKVTDHEKSEKNLYDGEISYTDHYIGQLLDFLQSTGLGERTIVFITADHGDAFDEHGGSNHGWNVYDELIHVPLLIHVPDLPPRVIDGPVSNLDVLPTMADIAGVLPTRPEERFAGVSLVPQIFYGREARSREVFAETNFTLYGTAPVRAIVDAHHKLIWNLKPNTFELYDLDADPHELRNLYALDRADAGRLQADLEGWLDRVFYAQGQRNQAARIRSADVLTTAPRPQFSSLVVLGGVLAVTGYDLSHPTYRPGETAEVTVYFHPIGKIPSDYDLYVGAELAAPPLSGVPGAIRQLPLVQDSRTPFDGFYQTSAWRTTEWERQRFTIRLPLGSSSSSAVRLVLWLRSATGAPLLPSPATRDPLDPTGARALLGVLPLAPPETPLVIAPPPRRTLPSAPHAQR